EGDRRDGARGVVADAGQRAQAVISAGELAAHLARHDLCRLVQVAGARVVAEPRPGGEHVVEGCRGECFHRRPAFQELAIIAGDRLNGGLLQHDLAQPHVIGIGAPAPGRAPGQHPAMLVVPGQQPGGWIVLGDSRISLRRWHFEQAMAQKPKDKQLPLPLPQRRGKATTLGEEAGPAGKAAFARAGFSDPTLLLHWEEIAGTDTARLTRPLRLTQGPSGGVLTLKTEPGAAVFLQHESRPLCERINTYLGRPVVARLRFVQGTLKQPPPPPVRRKAKSPVPPTDPALKYQGPEGLKEALVRLAKARRPPINKAQD